MPCHGFDKVWETETEMLLSVLLRVDDILNFPEVMHAMTFSLRIRARVYDHQLGIDTHSEASQEPVSWVLTVFWRLK